MTLYLVAEGEQYHEAWIPHVIYQDREQALDYAKDLVQSSGVTRWPNAYVYVFELGQPGGEPLGEIDIWFEAVYSRDGEREKEGNYEPTASVDIG